MVVTKRDSSSSSSDPENPEGGQEKPYVLVPVDRYGDNKESCDPLSDKG